MVRRGTRSSPPVGLLPCSFMLSSAEYSQLAARDAVVEAVDALLADCGLPQVVGALSTSAAGSLVAAVSKRLAVELESLAMAKQVRVSRVALHCTPHPLQLYSR